MTDFEELCESGIAVFCPGFCTPLPIVHGFEYNSKNIIILCLPGWRTIQDGAPIDNRKNIVFLKGVSRNLIDGSFQINRCNIHLIRDEEKFLVVLMKAFKTEAEKAPELFSRAEAEKAIWNLYEKHGGQDG